MTHRSHISILLYGCQLLLMGRRPERKLELCRFCVECKEPLALSCTLTESVGERKVSFIGNSRNARAKSSWAAKLGYADLQKKPATRSRLRSMAGMTVQVHQQLTQGCVFKRAVVMEP